MPIFEAVGGRSEQVAALERDEHEADCFSAEERAVIAFTTEVVRDARAGDESLRRRLRALSARARSSSC